MHAALWAVDEAVNRDIPLRLVYVIDPSQLAAAGEAVGNHNDAAARLSGMRPPGNRSRSKREVLCGRPLTKLMQESRSAAMLCAWFGGA